MRAPWRFGAAVLIAGCATGPTPEARTLTLPERLAGVGLEVVNEDEARIPAAERGRFVPVRVLPGFPSPALPEHAAGYLIVGVDGRLSDDADAILHALQAWVPGETLKIRARRNPYLLPATEWWEAEVLLR